MTDDVRDVPILMRRDRGERVQGRVMDKVTLYQPPLSGDPDAAAEFDMWVSRQVIGILDKHYPGYPWNAKCNSAQGIVYFNIPALMGETLHWLIKLRQWEEMVNNGERLVKEGGGQLLERMGLPRGGFEEASFVRARGDKASLDFADSLKRRVY